MSTPQHEYLKYLRGIESLIEEHSFVEHRLHCYNLRFKPLLGLEK